MWSHTNWYKKKKKQQQQNTKSSSRIVVISFSLSLVHVRKNDGESSLCGKLIEIDRSIHSSIDRQYSNQNYRSIVLSLKKIKFSFEIFYSFSLLFYIFYYFILFFYKLKLDNDFCFFFSKSNSFSIDFIFYYF